MLEDLSGVPLGRMRNGHPWLAGFVYVMAAPMAVKIGWSGSPSERFKVVQSCSPVPLQLALQIPGPKPLEKHLHAYFAGRRLHGEWFEPSVLAEIESAASRSWWRL